ncbi:MAG: DUF692 family protein [Myxococcales bacterium]|nr:DUF692 family protein [Myxococcales bacterium]
MLAGAGIGLRDEHAVEILAERPPVAWFEVLADNYLGQAGPAFDRLLAIREHYPITLHSVGLSLGSTDPLDEAYVERLTALAERLEPEMISDHLCWISANGRYVHELLPLPFTEEAVEHVSRRIKRLQERFGRRMLIENVSRYLTFESSTMCEWAFVRAILEHSDCDLLLDVSNVYVNAQNHGFDPLEYIGGLPAERVKQFHLGGFEHRGPFLLDTHGAAIADPVWALFRQAVALFGPQPTLIEWDNDLPPLATLRAQCETIASILGGPIPAPPISSPQRPALPISTPQIGAEARRASRRSLPLRELQHALVEQLMDRGAPFEGSPIAEEVSSPASFSNAHRLALYRNLILTALSGALADVFPLCQRLLGDEYFGAATRRYAASVPSRSANIHDYGDAFASFLETLGGFDRAPYVGDVARLEWAWHRAFYAADAESFDLASLAAVPENEQPRLRFLLSPSLSLIASPFPLQQIFEQAQRDEPERVDLDHGGPQWLAVWRDAGEIHLGRLQPTEWQTLEAIRQGATLSELASIAQGAEGDARDRSYLSDALPSFVTRGWIVGFRRATAGGRGTADHAS